MNTLLLLSIVWVHFVADFVMQSREVARNKSGSNKVLAKHVLIYGAPMMLFGPLYAAANVALHFATDYVTSRATKRLWAQKREHAFFTVIGADQAVHMTCLVATLPLSWWS